MEKLIKDGKVAVLVSGGFGAGWSTWGKNESCMDGEIAQAIIDKDIKKAQRIAHTNWPDEYDGGIEDCSVEWVEQGIAFEISEYDGAENLRIIGEIDHLIA